MYSSTKIISEAVCVCACVSSEKNISSAHTAAAWANNHQGGQGRHPQRQEPEAARGKKKSAVVALATGSACDRLAGGEWCRGASRVTRTRSRGFEVTILF